jgi:hypothetical protein
MNERIKELSDIAYNNHIERNLYSSFGRRSDYDKEFAQLIIRECAKLASEETSLPYDSYSEKIKQHFGVES